MFAHPRPIIGLNTNGFIELLNADNGVEIGVNAHHNSIGGFSLSVIPVPDQNRNNISDNANHGIELAGRTNHNEVIGNLIVKSLLVLGGIVVTYEREKFRF